MTRYAKQKKAERKGLRIPSAVNGYASARARQWMDRLREILAKKKLLESDKFFLEYSQAVCKFRLAIIESKDSTPFWEAVAGLEKKLEDGEYSLSFNKEEDEAMLLAINRMFRDKAKSELEQICQVLESKLGANFN